MKKLSAFLETVIVVIGLIILSLLTYVNLTRTVTVVLNQWPYEKVKVLAINSFCFLIFLFFAGLLWFSQRQFKKIRPRNLFLVCSVIFLCLGLYLTLVCPLKIRYDQRYVLAAADHLNHNNFRDFTSYKGYLNQYPFQLGFVTFERPLLLLFGTNAVRALFLINLACVIAINFFIWQLTALTTDKKRVQNYAILFNFFFLPEFFYIVFAYGSLPGFCCLMASFYLMALWWRKNKWFYFLTASILVILAYQLKNNYLIGILALVIAALLNFLRTKKWLNLAFIALTAFLLAGSNWALNSYYSSLTRQEVNVTKGIPKSLYFVMGLNKNRQRSDGWYDSSTVKAYTRFKGNFNQAQHYGDKQLQQKAAHFYQHPQQAADLFKNKIVSTWGDPLFQSIWIGPHPQFRQKLNDPFWQAIYDPHNFANHLILNFCHALYIIILISALIGSWHYLLLQHQHLFLLLLTYFIGGFCFHLISETKSQYVFNYVIALLPLAAIGLDYLMTNLQLKINNWQKKKK